MEAVTILTNLENLVKHSSEMATSHDVDLADTWLWGQSNKGVSDPLSDPFAIVTEHHKRQKTNTSGSVSDNKRHAHIGFRGRQTARSKPANFSAYESFCI